METTRNCKTWTNSIQFGDGEFYFSVASYLDQSLFSLENCTVYCVSPYHAAWLHLAVVRQHVPAGAVPWWVTHQLGPGRSHQHGSHIPLGPDISKLKPGLVGRKWYEQTSCQLENYLMRGHCYAEGRNWWLLLHCLFFDLGKIFAECILGTVMWWK